MLGVLKSSSTLDVIGERSISSSAIVGVGLNLAWVTLATLAVSATILQFFF